MTVEHLSAYCVGVLAMFVVLLLALGPTGVLNKLDTKVGISLVVTGAAFWPLVVPLVVCFCFVTSMRYLQSLRLKKIETKCPECEARASAPKNEPYR